MSFGFGVGDFLAVIQLATKLRKNFSDAPEQFEVISDEVKSLAILLSDVAVYEESAVHKLDPSQAENLKTVVNGSTRVLQDLEELLSRYETLNPGYGSSGRYRPKRLWERLTFDSKDVVDLRSRLTSNITMLHACLRNLTERSTQRSLARLEKHVDMQEQQQILDWVSKDCERQRDRLNWLIQRREIGTRKWLFDSPKWQTWTSEKGRGTTLFCPGIPGAGKTHTSAMVIERLSATFSADEVGLAFAFCDYQRSDDKEHVYLAKSLLRMFLEQPHAWPLETSAKYEYGKRLRSDLTMDEVLDLLKASIRQRANNFVIVDALDELHDDSRRILITKLLELQEDTRLNIFVTSRDIGQISDLFSQTDPMRIGATGEDIEQFLSTRMGSLPPFVLKSVELQNVVKSAIVQAAGEMYAMHIIQRCLAE
ncbi:hypothetical protein Daus18300_000580 [Diaporthe australafricana]|uniref:Nephrocystin 3-like N-terminal domain-containing protein n=1 Tax=Diaporthe australafricana TaxID=127596 RepID=A0ABR3Y558_9PEZI